MEIVSSIILLRPNAVENNCTVPSRKCSCSLYWTCRLLKRRGKESQKRIQMQMATEWSSNEHRIFWVSHTHFVSVIMFVMIIDQWAFSLVKVMNTSTFWSDVWNEIPTERIEKPKQKLRTEKGNVFVCGRRKERESFDLNTIYIFNGSEWMHFWCYLTRAAAIMISVQTAKKQHKEKKTHVRWNWIHGIRNRKKNEEI